MSGAKDELNNIKNENENEIKAILSSLDMSSSRKKSYNIPSRDLQSNSPLKDRNNKPEEDIKLSHVFNKCFMNLNITYKFLKGVGPK